MDLYKTVKFSDHESWINSGVIPPQQEFANNPIDAVTVCERAVNLDEDISLVLKVGYEEHLFDQKSSDSYGNWRLVSLSEVDYDILTPREALKFNK